MNHRETINDPRSQSIPLSNPNPFLSNARTWNPAVWNDIRRPLENYENRPRSWREDKFRLRPRTNYLRGWIIIDKNELRLPPPSFLPPPPCPCWWWPRISISPSPSRFLEPACFVCYIRNNFWRNYVWPEISSFPVEPEIRLARNFERPKWRALRNVVFKTRPEEREKGVSKVEKMVEILQIYI